MSHVALDFIGAELEKACRLVEDLRNNSALADQISQAADICSVALENGRKIMIAGNGGSAADAQHWAGELVSRFHYDRPGLAAVALTTDTSILTAIANDYGYSYVFARQIEALGTAGDVFIALSTSGRSPNIIEALQAARTRKVFTIGMTGGDDQKMAVTCDVCIRVPSRETPQIQQGHEIIGHILCGLIERRLFPRA